MDLKEAIETLDGSFGFGNGILYDMCSSSTTDLSNPYHLSDMIWLIGRAYAASPERRTYGYEKDVDGKLKKDTKDKWIPLWKATNADDGKGDYFISIARDIVNSKNFNSLLKIVSAIKDSTYSYDNGESDIAALSNGIYAVYLYNALIRDASEEFDGLNLPDNPKAVAAKKSGARCKNQISFCSKFLHFHCPGIVFIIDQYSFEGGKRVIPLRKLSCAPKFETDSKELVPLEAVTLKNAYQEVLMKVTAQLKKLDSNLFENDTISNEEEKILSYVYHCTRAYCVAKHLRDQINLMVNPRLIDDLFLRIKK